MYKNASRNMQHAAISEPKLKIVGGSQNLTTAEQYESAKQAYNRLIEINKLETDKVKKKIYGYQLKAMMENLAILRDKYNKEKPPDQVTDYIVRILRDKYSKEEWQEIIAEAKRMALAN